MRTVEEERVLDFQNEMIIPKTQPIISTGIGLVDDTHIPVPIESPVLTKVCPGYSLISVTEVTESLLLCGAAALTPELLRDLGVTCVVNATSELPDTPLPLNSTISYARVYVNDKATEDLEQHFDSVSDIIEKERLQGGKTLIHCVAGVSRSAALCLAYLVKFCSMSLREAFQHLRSKRPCVRPNSGFFSQLIDFERRILGSSTVSMVHNQVVASLIPDVYEHEYMNVAWYQKHYRRNLGRR